MSVNDDGQSKYKTRIHSFVVDETSASWYERNLAEHETAEQCWIRTANDSWCLASVAAWQVKLAKDYNWRKQEMNDSVKDAGARVMRCENVSVGVDKSSQEATEVAADRRKLGKMRATRAWAITLQAGRPTNHRRRPVSSGQSTNETELLLLCMLTVTY